MDVVYILGDGSKADNEEIRYSLRSLERNMLDIGNVYIVGILPDFLQDVRHIPCEDRHEKRWKNAMEKTRLAASTDGITDEFLLMNDDFFMLSPFQGDNFPFYAKKGNDGGCNGRTDFQIHCPIRIQKEWYLNLPLSLDMAGDWSPRSFYCNFYQAPPTFIVDPIVRCGISLPSYEDQTKNLDFFSIGSSTMLRSDFSSWLARTFPDPSRFEI